MMFFPLEEIDDRWHEACDLYRAGKLVGINSMKVSTAKPNSQRIYDEGEGIIIFYCGMSTDKENIMEYGRNILQNMHYPRDTFYYKSDQPHLINYSKKYRHMYSINTHSFYNNGSTFEQEEEPNFQNIQPATFKQTTRSASALPFFDGPNPYAKNTQPIKATPKISPALYSEAPSPNVYTQTKFIQPVIEKKNQPTQKTSRSTSAFPTYDGPNPKTPKPHRHEINSPIFCKN